jgi:hypothetical protein
MNGVAFVLMVVLSVAATIFAIGDLALCLRRIGAFVHRHR